MAPQQLNLALVLIGGVVLLLGLFSNTIKNAFLSEPLVAMMVGIVLGPQITGLFDIGEWGNQQLILEQIARLTLAIGLMGVALRLPRDFFIKYWRPLTVLLIAVMTLMWLAGGIIAYLVLGLPFWVAMLLGATITPTDPVLASTIVTGNVAEKNLPQNLREVLSSESGANDGLGYLFVFLPIFIMTYPPGEVAVNWVLTIVLREVVGGVILGFLLGYGSGIILRWAESRRTVGMTSLLAFTVSLALVALGLSYLIGSDGILAVFVAGAGFSLTVGENRKERQEHQEHFQEAVNRFFVIPIFVLFGMALPWQGWFDLGWAGITAAVLIILFRRIPAIMSLNWALGPVKGWKNSFFIGWFGPIGVAAIYYSTLSQRITHNDQIWIMASLVIFISIIAHGITSTPLTLLYAKSTQKIN